MGYRYKQSQPLDVLVSENNIPFNYDNTGSESIDDLQTLISNINQQLGASSLTESYQILERTGRKDVQRRLANGLCRFFFGQPPPAVVGQDVWPMFNSFWRTQIGKHGEELDTHVVLKSIAEVRPTLPFAAFLTRVVRMVQGEARNYKQRTMLYASQILEPHAETALLQTFRPTASTEESMSAIFGVQLDMSSLLAKTDDGLLHFARMMNAFTSSAQMTLAHQALEYLSSVASNLHDDIIQVYGDGPESYSKIASLILACTTNPMSWQADILTACAVNAQLINPLFIVHTDVAARIPNEPNIIPMPSLPDGSSPNTSICSDGISPLLRQQLFGLYDITSHTGSGNATPMYVQNFGRSDSPIVVGHTQMANAGIWNKSGDGWNRAILISEDDSRKLMLGRESLHDIISHPWPNEIPVGFAYFAALYHEATGRPCPWNAGQGPRIWEYLSVIHSADSCISYLSELPLSQLATVLHESGVSRAALLEHGIIGAIVTAIRANDTERRRLTNDLARTIYTIATVGGALQTLFNLQNVNTGLAADAEAKSDTPEVGALYDHIRRITSPDTIVDAFVNMRAREEAKNVGDSLEWGLVVYLLWCVFDMPGDLAVAVGPESDDRNALHGRMQLINVNRAAVRENIIKLANNSSKVQSNISKLPQFAEHIYGARRRAFDNESIHDDGDYGEISYRMNLAMLCTVVEKASIFVADSVFADILVAQKKRCLPVMHLSEIEGMFTNNIVRMSTRGNDPTNALRLVHAVNGGALNRIFFANCGAMHATMFLRVMVRVEAYDVLIASPNSIEVDYYAVILKGDNLSSQLKRQATVVNSSYHVVARPLIRVPNVAIKSSTVENGEFTVVDPTDTITFDRARAGSLAGLGNVFAVPVPLTLSPEAMLNLHNTTVATLRIFSFVCDIPSNPSVAHDDPTQWASPVVIRSPTTSYVPGTQRDVGGVLGNMRRPDFQAVRQIGVR